MSASDDAPHVETGYALIALRTLTVSAPGAALQVTTPDQHRPGADEESAPHPSERGNYYALTQSPEATHLKAPNPEQRAPALQNFLNAVESDLQSMDRLGSMSLQVDQDHHPSSLCTRDE